MKDKFRFLDKIHLGMGKGVHSKFTLKANMKLELFGPDGNLKDIREVHNTVTAAAKEGIMDQILATPTLAKVGWMEVGTGTPGATLLGAYISGSRTAFISKIRGTNDVTMVCTFGAGVGTGAITEAGTFNIATQNTVDMWMSASFAVINKGAADSLTITWVLTGN